MLRPSSAATYGPIPFWSRDRSIGRKTYNARSETVAEKPAYRGAWRQRHFRIAPMAAFY
jgi:putative SOS response-associated peptidase YedK